jgi:hypothetical protein
MFASAEYGPITVNFNNRRDVRCKQVGESRFQSVNSCFSQVGSSQQRNAVLDELFI